MYGHGSHLSQWTTTIIEIFRSPNLRRLHMKFEQNWLSEASEEKSFENVNGWTDIQMDVQTNAL